MQAVPAAQLRRPQQEKNLLCLFSAFYLWQFLFSVALDIELIQRQKKKKLFEKKACGAKEKSLFLAQPPLVKALITSPLPDLPQL